MVEPSVWLSASVELSVAIEPAARGSAAMKERRRKECLLGGSGLRTSIYQVGVGCGILLFSDAGLGVVSDCARGSCRFLLTA